MEYNLVEMWLRRDPIRWVAGLCAGIFSSCIAIGVGVFLANRAGMASWFFPQLIGTIVQGPHAMCIGTAGVQGTLAGIVLLIGLGGFLGFLYSHFVVGKTFKSLIPMGVVWGTLSWIFIWNLFLQSFHTISAAQASSSAAIPICMAFGVSLASLSFFEKCFRSLR